MSNFYDFVSNRFPLTSHAQAVHNLEFERLEREEKFNTQSIEYLNNLLKKYKKDKEDLIWLLKDLRGCLLWDILIHNKVGISEPFDNVDNIIKEIDKVLARIK